MSEDLQALAQRLRDVATKIELEYSGPLAHEMRSAADALEGIASVRSRYTPDHDGYCIHCHHVEFMHDAGRYCAMEALAQVAVEPEVVWHDTCPKYPEPDDMMKSSHPRMDLVQRLDDEAGHKRVYRCPSCEMVVDVNYPPVNMPERSHSEQPTMERIEHLEEQLGLVYDYITHGKLSKPYDFTGAIRAEIDDAITEQFQEYAKEEQAEQPTCSTCRHPHFYKGVTFRQYECSKTPLGMITIGEQSGERWGCILHEPKPSEGKGSRRQPIDTRSGGA